jgi:hypothetical protein
MFGVPARDLGLALLIAAGGLAVLVWLIPAAPLTGDGPYYVAFAESHLQHGAASTWHARRVLGPLIVAALPLSALAGFHILTVASLLVASLLTWFAALSLGLHRRRAAIAIVFFLGSWAAAPNLREYALVDPLAWAFVAAIWLATAHRRWWIAAALGAVGALAKEVVVVAAVAAAAAAWSPRGGWIRAATVAAPSLLVVAALTVIVPGSGTDATAYLTKWISDGLGSLGPARVVYLMFASYAALWLLVPKGFPALPEHLRRATVVYLIAAVLLPAVGSPERMEELIFPAVIAAACGATRNWPAPAAFALAIANAIFVARVGGDAHVPSVVSWIALALATLLALGSYAARWSYAGRSGRFSWLRAW